MPVDLHVHTNASDGTETPLKVVQLAKETGLEAIAITDHDTLDGLFWALKAGREAAMEVIPGVELSTECNDTDIHILGYFIDPYHQVFLRHLVTLREKRVERAFKMVKKLQDMGAPISFNQVKEVAGKSSLGRPHIARTLMYLGFVNKPAEAFERYIGRGCPAYIPRFKYAPEKAVKLVLQARGVPVMAHPGLAGCDEIIPSLVEAGLKGIEVYYPKHAEQQVKHYLKLCEKYFLLPTGGSDYHGSTHKEHSRLASATVPYLVVQKLKKAAKQAGV